MGYLLRMRRQEIINACPVIVKVTDLDRTGSTTGNAPYTNRRAAQQAGSDLMRRGFYTSCEVRHVQW